ncbi:MAG: GC-type dockerin domain-anchored protein [Phycisphaerales bacterium]
MQEFTMRVIVPVAVAVQVLAVAAAHAQTRLWSVRFGTPVYDSPFDLLEDGQGGVFVSGVSGGLGGPSRQNWLARFDSEGSRQWQVPVGDPGRAGPPTLAPASGGVHVLSGFSSALLESYSESGDRNWSEYLVRTSEAVVAVGDGSEGVYVAGIDFGFRVSRRDAEGQLVWETTLPLAEFVEFGGWGWSADGEGGLLLAGTTYSPIVAPLTGNSDPWVARVGPDGTLLWVKQRGDWEGIVTLRPVNGGFLQGGYGGLTDRSLIGLFDLDGDPIWQTEIDSPMDLETVEDVLALPDAGVLALVQRVPDLRPKWSDDYSTWLVRLDANQNVLWTRNINANSIFIGLRLAPTDAGGVILAGWVAGPLGGGYVEDDSDAFLARYWLCLPDLTSSAVASDPGYGVPDGRVNNDDFFYYLGQFAAGNAAVCDLTDGSVLGQPGYGTPDGVLNASDFFYFVDFFVRGC